jgi:hypothetical protein
MISIRAIMSHTIYYIILLLLVLLLYPIHAERVFIIKLHTYMRDELTDKIINRGTTTTAACTYLQHMNAQ